MNTAARCSFLYAHGMCGHNMFTCIVFSKSWCVIVVVYVLGRVSFIKDIAKWCNNHNSNSRSLCVSFPICIMYIFPHLKFVNNVWPHTCVFSNPSIMVFVLAVPRRVIQICLRFIACGRRRWKLYCPFPYLNLSDESVVWWLFSQ